MTLTPETQAKTSTLIPRSTPSIQGFCHNYPLRRHKYEHEKANLEGSFQCRTDWERYIGPVGCWGSCNPWEGHFGAVVLPLCWRERLGVVCYVFEYAFPYDNVVESAAQSTLNGYGDNITLDETEYRTVRSITGTKQIQSKMLLELLSIDRPCAEVVIDSWKTMIATTAHKDKARAFGGLEEYVEYRIVDTGAPFVDTLMRFGMGLLLTPEENDLTYPIVKPCYAALGLANDYFSFDVEWEEYQQEQQSDKPQGDKKAMTNLVWLFMHWRNVGIPEAKEMVRHVVNGYEQEFLQKMEVFLTTGEGKGNDKLRDYLTAQAYQVSGNVTWSLRCPRYHPELCEEGERLLHGVHVQDMQDPIASKQQQQQQQQQQKQRMGSISDTSVLSSNESTWSPENSTSLRSSISSAPDDTQLHALPKQVTLGEEHLSTPLEYINSLPSKGIREVFIDALNVWLVLPDHLVKELKSIVQTLHNTSLMLDDIEDSTPLRRSLPATHTIYGEALTINAANYHLLSVADQIRRLDDTKTNKNTDTDADTRSECMDIFMEEMRNLFIGQSFDLYWTRFGECPSQEEYLEMVNQKTGGLFRLITRLMIQKSPTKTNQKKKISSLDTLVSYLGKYFQIRDDYMNLTPEYTAQKGLCSDLTEGKFSFPVVHALTTTTQSSKEDSQLRGILHQYQSQSQTQAQNKTDDTLDTSLKQCFLQLLHQAGSMEYTEKVLRELMGCVMEEVRGVEREMGCENWVLRLLVYRIEV